VSNTDQDNAGLIDELRRRKVLRSTTIYAVVAWCLLQLSDLLFTRLGFPDWSVKLMLTAVVLGFPVVVALAWVFDVLPDGVHRAAGSGQPLPPPAAPNRMLDVFVFLLFVATVAVLYWSEVAVTAF
jgi:hypothetical protein